MQNYLGERVLINSALNATGWEKYRGILSEPEVVDFVKYGFPTGHDHKQLPSTTLINHSSATKYAPEVDEYLKREIEHGSIVGPLHTKPFHWTKASPLMTREKGSEGGRRVILDLSYPPCGSVNDGIPKDSYLGQKFKLKLPSPLSLRDAIRESGQGCWLWSTDMARAYRQLCSDPIDYPLLGIFWRSKWFIDLSIPFGLRHGAKCCQQVTGAITHILKSKGHFGLSYIDDLAGVHTHKEQSQAAFDSCSAIMSELGLTEAKDKRTAPSTTMTWLGVRFNTQNMLMFIPQEKLQQVAALVKDWTTRSTCTLPQLRSLLGKLFFVASCSTTLRLFCNRMLDSLREANEHEEITLSDDFRLDLLWIDEFMPQYNGVDVIDKAPTFPVDLIIDSCLTGGGGHLGHLWFAFKYPQHILDQQFNIAELEMINALIAVKFFAPNLQGHSVLLRCDNAPTVCILQNGRGKSSTLLHCAREVWRVTAKYRVVIQVSHIPGSKNDLADLLSRAHKSMALQERLNERIITEGGKLIDVDDSVFIF